jgi:hypothetical protein
MTASIEAAGPAGALALRRRIYASETVSRQDLLKLLEISRAAGDSASREFSALLAEVATDQLVRQVDPPKYVAREDVAWLIAHLGRSGGLNRAEFGMLAEVLRQAINVPPGLVTFVVHEVEKKIVNGAPCKVAHDDLDVLRTAVFAATEGSSLHVDKDSAEALFRIAHATSAADNDPGFDDFFAKAVGNYLMGIAMHCTPSVEDERRMNKWLEEKPKGVDDILRAVLRFDASGDAITGIEFLTGDSDGEEARLRLANEAAARRRAIASEIDPAETDWLLAHLTRDGALTSAEKRLLSFLKEEAPSMPPSLLAIIERQAA